MIEFTIEKLLCRLYDPSTLLLGNDELFAIISRRLALDFDTTGIIRELKQKVEMDQMKQPHRLQSIFPGVGTGWLSEITHSKLAIVHSWNHGLW
jgi:hypothetical protein